MRIRMELNMCVLWCVFRFHWTLADDSIHPFRGVCYFSTAKEQHRRDSNPTYELFKRFQTMSNLGRLLRLLLHVQSVSSISHLHVSSMSFPREGWTEGLQGTAFSNSTEYSAVREFASYKIFEMRYDLYVRSYCSHSSILIRRLGTLSHTRTRRRCKMDLEPRTSN